MKFKLFCLFLISLFILTNQISQPAPPPKSKWRINNIDHAGNQLKVVHHRKIDTRKVSKLIDIIDGSMSSKRGSQNGYIRPQDVICISNKMIYWFSASSKGLRYIRTGGGLLAGMWEIKNDPQSGVILKRVERQTNFVKNLLYPGSTGKNFFGADVYGGYLGSNAIWGLENSVNTRQTSRLGRDIIDSDRGAFASDEGVFIEFEGLVGNSNTGKGIETMTDTDPRPGIIGQTKYTLTYRIPANKNEIIQEIEFKALKNNFGPINTAKLSLFFPGYGSYNMEYAANTELLKSGTINLNDVTVNKYFKNSCEPKVYFYKVPFVNQKNKFSASTSDGRGTLSCVGSPENRVPFICAYPNNEFIPKIAYEDYTMELFDNQSIPRIGRFQGITYRLLKSEKKSFTLVENKKLILIMRYKVIPAFVKLNSKSRRG